MRAASSREAGAGSGRRASFAGGPAILPLLRTHSARPHAGSGAMKKGLIIIPAVLILGFVGFVWLTLHWSYSTGERAGYVQKLSRKGWVCKTWEGEMAMVTMPGTVSEKFQFTIPDAAIADKINANLGKRMTLTYEQHRWLPSSCFGDTEYFVTDGHVTE
jgi:hypothetical protein